MNHNNCSYIDSTPRLGPLVTDEITFYIEFALFIVASSCVSLFGIITNVINMAVYLKQGIKDSATVHFFALSVTDLVFCILVLVTSLSVLVNDVRPDATVLDHLTMFSLISQSREKVYSLSIVITIFLSIERCFCVMFPFKVKTIFTRNRSIKFVSSVAFIFGLVLIPDYMTQNLAWKFNFKFNSTKLVTWQAPDRLKFNVFKNILFAFALPAIADVTNTICATIMLARVKSPGKLRQINVAETQYVQNSGNDLGFSGVKFNNSKATLTKKERKLARTVIVVDIIFIICNIPKLMILASTVAEYYIPGFTVHKKSIYHNVVFVIVIVTYTMETVNAAVNFLVYYFTSTRFRSEFRQIFCHSVIRNLGNTSSISRS